jgi:hypothetical protein
MMGKIGVMLFGESGIVAHFKIEKRINCLKKYR